MARKAKVEAPKKSGGVKMQLIVSPAFRQGLSLLMGGNTNIKAAYQILKVNEEVEKLYAHYEELRRSLVEKHGKRGEDNKLLMSEDGSKYLLKDEGLFDTDFKQLLDLDVEVSKIPLTSIAEVRLPPSLLAVMIKTIINPEL